MVQEIATTTATKRFVYIYIYHSQTKHVYVGVRDCPYAIRCPWVHGGWDLDAVGNFFLRHCRRRRPLLFRQILENKQIIIKIGLNHRAYIE